MSGDETEVMKSMNLLWMGQLGVQHVAAESAVFFFLASAMEDAMAKALGANDNTAQNQGRPPQQQSGDKPNQQKLAGKALQVNENSVEDQESAPPAPPRQRSGDKPNQQKLAGKALQVNENSVEDQQPARSPAPPRRE
jgi:hypothetical protein